MPWEELAGATVLVTGATGLVGSFLVECLLARRAGPSTKVVVLSRDASRAAARLAHHDPDRWRVLEHALDAPVTVPVQVDYVVHAGAPARPDELAADPVAAYVPNVLGTHHLLEWAASAGVARFCFVSSGAANGSVPPELDGYGEDRYGPVDPIDPYACYAESKRMGEAACMAWWRATGMETVVARLGHTYGPGLSRSDTRSFAQFVHCAVDGRDILLRSDGAARRPFCYLSDAITGLLTVLLVAPAGSAYFVVNDAAVCSIRELADLVARLAPPPGIAVREAHGGARGVHPPDDAGGALPSAARLRALGWSPRVAL
nr:NAD-dependent epimerase/dehydratase family protein [Actinomycetota bacterium]